MGKLNHDALEKFVQEVLSKREPCPAMVLAWGWALKQVGFQAFAANRQKTWRACSDRHEAAQGGGARS